MALGRKLTPAQKKRAADLAGTGCPQCAIAGLIGTTEEVLEENLQEDEKFRSALAGGRGRIHQALSDALHRKALEGDFASLQFVLKTQHREGGWDQSSASNNLGEVKIQLEWGK